MNSLYKILFVLFAGVLFSCKSTSKLKTSPYKSEVFACYYHDKYNGRKTASGQRFSNKKLTAAHKSLAFGTKVKIENTESKKSVIVTINDRGPFSGGYEIDLSKKAFKKIEDIRKGKTKVNLYILK